MKTVKKITALFLFMLIVGGAAKAQNQSITEAVKEWERAKAYTKEYLDAMPDSAFSLKPTKEMRSFADQMLHIADGNYGFGSSATGEKSPVAMGLEKGTDKSKATVTKETLASYDFIINGLKKMSAAQLQEPVKVFDRFELTRELAMAKAFEHQTHHRGQGTVYLRMVGVTPPAEKLF